MIICEDKLCTGCGVCADVCPRNCISIHKDKDGFFKSFVDDGFCINCKKCVSVCPANNPNNNNEIFQSFKARRTDSDSILESSSGGIAALISEHFVKNKMGHVCGCAFDDNLLLKHTITSDLSQIEKFKGSKYLQSFTVGIYKEIKGLLEKGEKVLFIGTPCQVSACNNFLGKNYEHFYSVDLVCHGVPSGKVFDEYIKKYSLNKRIINVKYRDKVSGYRATGLNDLHFLYEDGTEQKINMSGGLVLWFASDLSLRESCYQCQFTSNKRCSDLSLADYKGELFTDDKKYGTSMVFINTKKGELLFNEISDSICFEEKNAAESVMKYNRLNCSKKPPKIRKKFFADLQKLSLTQMEQKYTLKRILPNRFVLYFKAAVNRVKKIVDGGKI